MEGVGKISEWKKNKLHARPNLLYTFDGWSFCGRWERSSKKVQQQK